MAKTAGFAVILGWMKGREMKAGGRSFTLHAFAGIREVVMKRGNGRFS